MMDLKEHLAALVGEKGALFPPSLFKGLVTLISFGFVGIGEHLMERVYHLCYGRWTY